MTAALGRLFARPKPPPRPTGLPALVDQAGAVVVLDVQDGDTIRLALVLDEHAGVIYAPWLRLTHRDYWVDAPEIDEPGGADAASWVTERLTGAEEVTVRLGGWSFARRVAEVDVDGRDLAEWLVAAGHGERSS